MIQSELDKQQTTQNNMGNNNDNLNNNLNNNNNININSNINNNNNNSNFSENDLNNNKRNIIEDDFYYETNIIFNQCYELINNEHQNHQVVSRCLKLIKDAIVYEREKQKQTVNKLFNKISNYESIENQLKTQLTDQLNKKDELDIENKKLKNELESLKQSTNEYKNIESIIVMCNKELLQTIDNNNKQFIQNLNTSLHQNQNQNQNHEHNEIINDFENESKPKSATQKPNNQTKSSSSSNTTSSWFNILKSSPSNVISKKDQSINFNYFSEDRDFSLSIQSFFKLSPIVVNGMPEKFLLKIEKCINIIDEPSEIISTQNKLKFAIYSIFSSGARVDWDKHKSNIESLQKKSNVVTILFIRSGKGANPLCFENYSGPQLNLKGFKGQIYDDDYNREQLRELCKSISQLKVL